MPSDIWLAFTTEGCEAKYARCVFCDEFVSRGGSIPSKQTTSNLKHHIDKKCKYKAGYEKLLKESKEAKATENKGKFNSSMIF